MIEREPLGPTRLRDLAVVLAVGLVIGYLVVRGTYGRMPTLPRLAGVFPAGLGLAAFGAGWIVRLRLNRGGRDEAGWENLRPIPALQAARILMLAKASCLAGALITGLWLGVLVHVVPSAATVVAAGDDTVTAVIGVIGALVMSAGSWWLEWCCRAPDRPDSS